MEEKADKKFFLEESEENRNLLQKYNKCDRYDYLVAVACGAVGGLTDIFLWELLGIVFWETGQTHRLIMW